MPESKPLGQSDTSPERDCKLCLAVGSCDRDCPLAFMAECRQPATPDEIAVAERIAFVVESNRIEGIDVTTPHDIEAHTDLWACSEIAVADLEQFVFAVSGKPLRREVGMNVRVGTHRPPPGGPEIERRLDELLIEAHDYRNPYAVHVAYETLHPFMDGNGRSGRALWAWMQLRVGNAPFSLPFLHRWYYDSLDYQREHR